MADCDITPISSRESLREWFGLIDEGTEAIGQRFADQQVIGADVFAAALRGEIQIHLIRIDEQPQGFFTTQPHSDMGGHKSLFVWLLYLRPTAYRATADVVQELEHLAREQACSAISFTTVRPDGWGRRLGRYGFAPSQVEFKKHLGVPDGRK